MNHRDAGAFEKKSPTQAQHETEKLESAAKPTTTSPVTSVTSVASTKPAPPRAPAADEILVVVSKVKDYIKTKSGGMSTSESVMHRLTQWVIRWSDASMKSAEANGRKTVLDRDVPSQDSNVKVTHGNPYGKF